jgi:hypothetical protein
MANVVPASTPPSSKFGEGAAGGVLLERLLSELSFMGDAMFATNLQTVVSLATNVQNSVKYNSKKNQRLK